MARRFARRPRVVWLPVDRSNRLGVSGDASVGTQTALFGASTAVPTGLGESHTEVFAVVADNPTDIALTGGINTLSDVEQSSYRLRRIVGKLWCGLAQQAGDEFVNDLVATAGFIILRVGPNGQPLATLNAAGAFESYNAQAIDQVMDPWIWRRSWRLGNIPQASVAPGAVIYPESNATLGSAPDGPHIDQKTARIVGAEERLFLVLSLTVSDGPLQTQVQQAVRWVGDFRVLASMRSNVGNRRNASR